MHRIYLLFELSCHAIRLYIAERYDEAIQKFEQVLERAPDSIASHFHKGVTHYKARQMSEAVDLFQAVLQLAPDSQYAETATHYLTVLAEQYTADQRPGAPNRWGLYLQAAYESDDNIPASPRGTDGELEDSRLTGFLSSLRTMVKGLSGCWSKK